MSDIINIDQFETIENIEVSVFPTYNEINVNRISGGGGSGAVSSVNGQTGDVVLTKSDLGLGNVDNTLDVNKPISSATQTALNLKVDKVTGKGLSTEDYTTVEKTKLSGIQDGAEVNVNADWNATSGDAMILNKPTLGSGDMLKSVYDKDNSGIVDNTEAIVIIGRNATGSTLRRGTIVYISGSTGNRPNFVKAQANGEPTSAGTFGVITDDINNNADGNCCVIGFLDNLDTMSNAPFPFTNDTLSDGDTIYLSPTTAGYITNVKPSAPNHLVYIGKVTRTSPTNGTIVYRIQNGYELEELHNVAISAETDKQLLSYDSATGLWKNKSVTTADVSDSTGKRYQTEDQKTFNDATSSIQTQFDSKQNKMSWISSTTPYSGTASTTLQKLSNAGSSGNGSFQAKANTRYKIEVQFILSGLSATNNNIYFGILGTVGITSVNGISTASKSSTLTIGIAPNQVVINSPTISQPLATSNTNTFAKAFIEIQVVTSNSGNLIVAFATNVSTTPIVENHIIRFIELGSSSQTSSSDIV